MPAGGYTYYDVTTGVNYIYDGIQSIWRPIISVATSSITFKSAGAVATAASGNVSPALPTGWAAGDVCFLEVATLDNVALTVTAGWTLIDVVKTNGALFETALYYRVLADGDTDPITVTHTAGNGISAFTVCYSGAAAGVDAVGVWRADSATTTCTATAITTIAANATVIMFGADAGAGTFSAWSSSATERQDNPATPLRPEVACADYLKASPGTTGDQTATTSLSLVTNGIMVALTPWPCSSSLKTSIAAYYNLANVNDAGPNGRTLTNNNAVTFPSSAGKPGAYANFVRASVQYLSINNNLGCTVNSVRTISLWFRATDNTNITNLISIGDTVTSGNPLLLLGYSMNGNSTKLKFYIGSQGYSAAGSVISNDVWYHIVLTSDGTAGGYHHNLYVNGNLTADIAFTAGSEAGSESGSFFIGGGVSGKHDGDIDSVGVWPVVLTPVQILNLYAAGAGLSYPFTGSP